MNENINSIDDFHKQNPAEALHNAIFSEDIALVKELLAKGASADSRDEEEKSALYNTCTTNNYELVGLLVEYAEINDTDYYCSGLYATDDNSIIDLLFMYGANRKEEDYSSCRYYLTMKPF